MTDRPRLGGRGLGLLTLGLAVAACQSPASSAGKRRAPGPSQLAASATPSPLSYQLSGRSLSEAVQASWSGEVRLISNHGGGIVSNHSSGLISNHGGGLISDHGGGIVSNHSSGIISNHSSGYRLAAAGWAGRLAQAAGGASGALRPEARLSEAQVVAFDLSGRVIVRPDGQPLAAMTDAQGRYVLEGQVPQGEAVMLRVALPGGGLLRAIALPGQSGQRDLDTASSLGSSYLLDEMLVGKRELLAKLPAVELARLDEAASAARARLGQAVPSYGLEESLGLAKRLKQEDAGFDRQLETIRSILLAGQSNLGEGLKATEVSLTLPQGLWPRADGALEILERLDRRVRRVRPDGSLSNHALTGPVEEQPTTVTAALPDGQDGLWVVDQGSHRVWHVDPQRKATLVAGTQSGAGLPPGPGRSVRLSSPTDLALAPQGGLFVSEWLGGRLLHLQADGQLVAIAPPVPGQLQGLGLASWSDGRLVWAFREIRYPAGGAAGRPETAGVYLWPRNAQGQWAPQPWTLPPGVADGPWELTGGWLAEADGSVLIARRGLHDVVRVASDGTLTPIAGQRGKPGAAEEGGPATQALLNAPWSLQRDAQGRVLIAQSGAGMVHRLEADGRLVRVAGTPSGGELTEGRGGVAINGPGGLAVDGSGAIVFPEGGGGQVQRIVGGKVQAFAGGQPGRGAEGVPALQAQFDGPTAVACDATGRTFVLDGQNRRVRVIEANGVVRTIAGGGTRLMAGPGSTVAMPAQEWQAQHLAAVAVDAAGRPLILDVQSKVVLRLEPKDGDPYGWAVPIAGVGGQVSPLTLMGQQGDRPATATYLGTPTALAFDRQGRLLIADGAAFCLWGLRPDGVLERVAGAPLGNTFQAMQGSAPDLGDPDGVASGEARLLAPVSLTVDPQGRPVVGEAGTARLQDLLNFTESAQLLGLRIGRPVGARLRRLEPDGRLTILAGEGGRALRDPEGDESLRLPMGLVFDPQGRLVVSDFLRNQLRMLPKSALSP